MLLTKFNVLLCAAALAPAAVAEENWVRNCGLPDLRNCADIIPELGKCYWLDVWKGGNSFLIGENFNGKCTWYSAGNCQGYATKAFTPGQGANAFEAFAAILPKYSKKNVRAGGYKCVSI
ncbi:hypothetical protein LTR64_001045 [Lithohypha guttulata]|uniref:uncharacterized protein n=1 Tax=Lithohypha guttulata TaxID=1690604 RepID=UPI002DE0E751|nr:hypothetical protein LTR51_003239 [Lithohypha guttulata]